MVQRQCKTFDDFIEMLEYYHPVIELREGGVVTFCCKMTDSEEVEIRHHDNNMKIYQYDSQDYDKKEGNMGHINFTRSCRGVIRSLIGNPLFHRYTEMVDHISNYIKFYEGKGKWGVTKVTKRGGEPMMLFFETDKKAKVFFNQLEKIFNCN